MSKFLKAVFAIDMLHSNYRKLLCQDKEILFK